MNADRYGELIKLVQSFEQDFTKFYDKENREAGVRLRKHMQELRDYAKQRIKSLKLSGQRKIRINNAGCLDRCDEGPVIVIYPEETWYTYQSREDIDEIIHEHLQHGRVVERLKLK